MPGKDESGLFGEVPVVGPGVLLQWLDPTVALALALKLSEEVIV